VAGNILLFFYKKKTKQNKKNNKILQATSACCGTVVRNECRDHFSVLVSGVSAQVVQVKCNDQFLIFFFVLFLGLNTFLVPEFWKLYFLVPEFQFASQMIHQFWEMTE
jgi:hypothetical protein